MASWLRPAPNLVAKGLFFVSTVLLALIVINGSVGDPNLGLGHRLRHYCGRSTSTMTMAALSAMIKIVLSRGV
jgi:hypothetical protein